MMLILYRILTIILFFFLPLILLWRFIKERENYLSVKQKFCFFPRNKLSGKLIWFHGASVGELQSITPLLEIYEKDKSIKKILITSNTLSSSRVLSKLKLKKMTHQFFPLDLNYFSKKFLNYWNPSVAFFIDSEVWPNMIWNLKEKKIPIILLNGRITKKTFNRWSILSNFANTIFNKFDLCLTSNKQSLKYLIKLGAKKVKYLGNLKFTQTEREINKINNNFNHFIKSKNIWCASSTHFNEEKLCGDVHKNLKKTHKNLLTIIIPRHVNRVSSIKKDLLKLGLKVHLDKPITKINKDTDIYLVNTYGNTKAFYAKSNIVFLGGSLVNHGGQNPLEAARYGCNILYGKNIANFKEIYEFLSVNKISYLTKTVPELTNKLDSLLSKKTVMSKNIKNKIKHIGLNVLKKTQKEINPIIKNEI